MFTPRSLPSICLLYFFLALLYAWATPPLESSDEYKHYPVTHHLANQRELVILDPDAPGKWLQEGAQPPLYYLLTAALTFWVNTDDLNQIHQINKHAFIGNPNQLHNKNLILHNPQANPWQGTLLAIYLIRLFSIGLGIGTLIFAYKLGDLLYSHEVGLWAAGLTALNPMFLFISAAVNNDSLAAFLGAWGIYALCYLWLELRTADHTPHERQLHPPTRRYLHIGLLCGLAMLTKLSLGGLLLLAGLILAWEAYRQREPLLLFRDGLLTLAVALALVAPWLWRNWHRYGDLTALNVFIAVQGTREIPTFFAVDWLAEFGTFYRSFWSLFGGVNVAAPQPVYIFYNALFILGMAGVLLKPIAQAHDLTSGWRNLWEELRHGRVSLLLLWVAILLILLIRWNIISPAFQGRLLFPALTAINVLWAAGLIAWGRHLRPLLGDGLARRQPLFAILFLIAAMLPFQTIAPAYAYPDPLPNLPADHAFGPYRFRAQDGTQLSLIGVDLEDEQTITAGTTQGVHLTLYWQLDQAPTHKNFVTAVDILGRELQSIGRVNRHPGWGMWPTSQWQPNQIYADPYYIPITAEAETPVLARIKVAVLEPHNGQLTDTLALSPTGEPIPLATVGTARIIASTPIAPAPQVALHADTTDFITLRGYDMPPQPQADGRLPLTLYWQANGTPSRDYTIFLQLLNADNILIASGDAPPLNGDYPTSAWQAGDPITDKRVLTIPSDTPAGTYRIAVGLYDPQTGERVPFLDGQTAVTWQIELD